ncbi:hypothetical protein HAV15_007886 [Penicillium sp. str. |uniref:Uncharacterized protein n=1 Tax=Penicillium solitum TaxID=60172 RepID=A0A1V6RNK1_9EURO|nr:uncharacterized protein PENSOL_c001G03997 [Penicillium solitum]KAF4760999.1 hypothetical protein HAV15_007886 [Penicillium sp. str. \
MTGKSRPFTTEILGSSPASSTDENGFPACFRGHDNTMRLPTNHTDDFLASELSLKRLEVLDKHLWLAGEKRSAWPLHYHTLIGRKILITEQMDLHLLWANDGRMFVKPLPRFLLETNFWSENLSCLDSCRCKDGQMATNMNRTEDSAIQALPECPRRRLHKCAMGFLYTYVCLVSYESDFRIANEHHLLPSRFDGSAVTWENWKVFVREILNQYHKDDTHPRFHRAELRLSRLNNVHRFTQFPLLEPYLRDRRNFGSLFSDNITWLATATVFVVLVLTAMQVGLATDQLKNSKRFMAASEGFTVFAILGPICGFGFIILDLIHHLLKELPWLIRGQPNPLNSPPVGARSAAVV